MWLPDPGVEEETVGLGDLARVMKDWMQSWEEVTTVAEQIIDAGGGKVTSMISYSDPGEALEAVGLSERDALADA